MARAAISFASVLWADRVPRHTKVRVRALVSYRKLEEFQAGEEESADGGVILSRWK